MTVNEWVELVQRSGGVCNDYMRKLAVVTNKTEMFRILCDVNGGAWLFELHARGTELPTEQFLKEFKNYVNGKKVVDYPSGYTSKFYCRATGQIKADTTVVYLLECKPTHVIVPKNHYPTIVLSDGSHSTVILEDGARANVELYGSSHFIIRGDETKVKISKH